MHRSTFPQERNAWIPMARDFRDVRWSIFSRCELLDDGFFNNIRFYARD